MKRIYSTAFFRHDASGYESERAGVARGVFFQNFIEPLLAAFAAVWSGWELWMYHDDRVMQLPCWATLTRAAKSGRVTLIHQGVAETLCGSMLWRLNPLSHPDVEWVVCRDVDSLPMHRERLMVEEAIASGAAAHAILDSESHGGPLMGGMTAYHGPTWREVVAPKWSVPSDIDLNQHGADQRVLKRVAWPILQSRTLVHQRRPDVMYPSAMSTRPVAPQTTPLDHVVRHIGAGYDVVRAMEVLAS